MWELADVIVRPLLIIFERLRQVEDVSEDWKRANVTPVFSKGRKEDPGYYWTVSLTLVPGNLMKKLILEIIYMYMKDKKVVGSTQHGFVKSKSCLTNLIAS